MKRNTPVRIAGFAKCAAKADARYVEIENKPCLKKREACRNRLPFITMQIKDCYRVFFSRFSGLISVHEEFYGTPWPRDRFQMRPFGMLKAPPF